jgi:glutamine amidotransferase-like uncharacterized protein
VSGDHVTATAQGRGLVRVESGTFADTAYVSVVPPGRLAAYFNGNIKLLETDGTAKKNVVATYGDNGEPLVAWTTSGRLVFQEMGTGSDFYTQLHLADTTGTRRLYINNPGGYQWTMHPATTPAGDVYFYGPGGVYHASSEGTGSVFIVAGVQPFPNKDGSKLGYVYGDSVFVRDMGTGQKVGVGKSIGTPKFSPTQDVIAFIGEGSDGLYVMNGDGSNLRMLAGGLFTGTIAWSPDGEWIAASKLGGDFLFIAKLELIRVSTGERLPIPGTFGYTEPAWRP